MKFIVPKKWSEFQHYKDRAPPWIKLHKALLDDMEFNQLAAFAAKVLVLFWVLASEKDNGWVEYDPGKIAFRMRLSTVEVAAALETLIDTGFILDAGVPETAMNTHASAEKMRQAHGFGSRHISDQVKREVWIHCGGKCVQCSSETDIEYDHIIPVSKGGSSEARNVQLLCRPCNRKKRTATPAEQVATPAQPDSAPAYYRDTSKEAETQEKAEAERENAPPLAAPLPIEPDSTKPASQPKATKGRRWRVDEEIPPNWIFEAEKSRSEHELPAVNLILEATKFANYWASKTGRGATHADWKRTWLNWALNAKGDANGRSRTPTKTEQWRDGIAAFIAAGEEPPGDPCDDHTRTPVAPNGTAGRGLSGERSGENDAAIPGVFRRLT